MKTASFNKPEFLAAREKLAALERTRDLAVAGCELANDGETRLRDAGAHDPTATPYFILEDLFGKMRFDVDSRLLDVGCSRGRTLAFFESAGLPGRADGVELDPDIAAYAAAWVGGAGAAGAAGAEAAGATSSAHPKLRVIPGNALDVSLAGYTHYYLFNPFDSRILTEFVRRVEEAATGPITFCHMSDNGEYYLFWGRYGWSKLAEGEFRCWNDAPIYEAPQHYTIWRYDPTGAE